MKTLPLTMETVAQISHVGWGGFLVLALCGGPLHLSPWLSFGIVTGLAAFKEAVIDPLIEDKQTQGNGWMDFFFFLVGTCAGRLLLFLK